MRPQRIRKPSLKATEIHAEAAAKVSKAQNSRKPSGIKKSKSSDKAKTARVIQGKTATIKKAAKNTASKKSAQAEPLDAKSKRKAARPITPVLSRKRKAVAAEDADEDDDDQNQAAPPRKRARNAPLRRKPRLVANSERFKSGKAINKAPTRALKVFTFGDCWYGELGLGNSQKEVDKATHPNLNHHLSAKTAGVVGIAVGAMHCAALTRSNTLLTWGCNEGGQLGRREGHWSLDNLHGRLYIPNAIDSKKFPEGTKFVQLVATDSATFVLTEDGSVYGWGTFEGYQGTTAFTKSVRIQKEPVKLQQLQSIAKLAAGANHVLALDTKGKVFSWGDPNGQRSVLGRRRWTRRFDQKHRLDGLVPHAVDLTKKIVDICCGTQSNFAVDSDSNIWAWGLNDNGQLAIPISHNKVLDKGHRWISQPTLVAALKGSKMKELKVGRVHSIACTEAGDVLVWGRADKWHLGVNPEILPVAERQAIRQEGCLTTPTRITLPTLMENERIVSVAAGGHTSFAFTHSGKGYSWGGSGKYQTGHGTNKDVDRVKLLEDPAIRDSFLMGAGIGERFGVLLAYADEE